MAVLTPLLEYLVRKGIGQVSLRSGSQSVTANTETTVELTPTSIGDIDLYYGFSAEETTGTGTGGTLTLSCEEVSQVFQSFPVDILATGIPLWAEVSNRNPFRIVIRAGANTVDVTYAALHLKIREDRVPAYRAAKAAFDAPLDWAVMGGADASKPTELDWSKMPEPVHLEEEGPDPGS